MQFRVDIQVLRGIAVTLVVFYHFQVPGFENGLLGVDIFFVISGFLMAKIYRPDEFKRFYTKRPMRLIPLSCRYLPNYSLGSLITLPTDFRQLYQQALFTTLL